MEKIKPAQKEHTYPRVPQLLEYVQVIGFTRIAIMIFANASVNADVDEGVIEVRGSDISLLVKQSTRHRIWTREWNVRF